MRFMPVQCINFPFGFIFLFHTFLGILHCKIINFHNIFIG